MAVDTALSSRRERKTDLWQFVKFPVVMMDDEDDLLLLFMLSSSSISNNKNTASFRSLLSHEGRSMRDRRIPRIALLEPNISSWVKLYTSGSESAMITLIGLDYPLFRFLSVDFEVLYNKYTPYSRNGKIILKQRNGRFHRPRCLDSHGCLALVTASVVSLCLWFGWHLLLKVLKSLDGAKVQMPSLDEIEEFKVRSYVRISGTVA